MAGVPLPGSEEPKNTTDDSADPTLLKEAAGEIPACCVATIGLHVRFNPMMVCAECKNIIKCFHDERAYQNYLTFCRSRRRPVLTGRIQEHWTVAFRSMDQYNR